MVRQKRGVHTCNVPITPLYDGRNWSYAYRACSTHPDIGCPNGSSSLGPQTDRAVPTGLRYRSYLEYHHGRTRTEVPRDSRLFRSTVRRIPGWTDWEREVGSCRSGHSGDNKQSGSVETVMSTTTGEIQPVASVAIGCPGDPAQGGPVSTAGQQDRRRHRRKSWGFQMRTVAPTFSSPLLGFSAEVVRADTIFPQGEHGHRARTSSTDEDGRTVVEVLDSNTGKVIRKIPPEKVSRFRDKDGRAQGYSI